MIKAQEAVQHVRSSRGAILRWNDIDLHTGESEEIKILLRRERVVAGHDKQAIVPQACSVPRKRPRLALDQSHSGRSDFASRCFRLPKNGTAPKRPCK